ncbi:hypothetical protein AK88_04979 [Plasmodium fragile]|uniref:Schizont-infected cell agglutination C-terminal domain-containing protein n=1 Tax=Plasmodium fragile TaxID=5857 RepID=A0A0D9QEG2_PLAFR|nr:uncharacterized protein AK88_04979 [Plasmodium fragile]KJP85379.1 hypothetical protein AK88_04979 [Plasmodium fragile]
MAPTVWPTIHRTTLELFPYSSFSFKLTGTANTPDTTGKGPEDSPPAPSSIPTTTGNDGNAGTPGVPGPSRETGARGDASTPVTDTDPTHRWTIQDDEIYVDPPPSTSIPGSARREQLPGEEKDPTFNLKLPELDVTSDTVTDRPTCDTVTHIPTCDDPKPDITDIPTCETVTDTPTCEDPKPEITQPPGSGNAVTDTHTCDHPQPDITDIPTHDTVPDIPTCEDPKPEITDIPTRDTVTDIPTCADPKPEITQPPGSGDAVTDRPTCDHPQPDITQHTSTHATVTAIPTCEDPKPEITDIPTCKAVTDTPTCADPKPEITPQPGSGNAVTDTPTCDHPQPDITDSPTCDTVTHIPTCEDPKPEITQPPGSGNAVTDTPTCDHPQPDITQHTVTSHTVTDTPTVHTTTWLRWIDRNKYLVRECTGQTWFNEIKSEWKQYLRAHMVANEDNGLYGHSEFGAAATLQINKLDAWKAWVAQQHRQMSMYGQEAWFQHLFTNVQEATVPATGEVHGVDNDLEVEHVMAAEHVLRVTVAPRSQLHQQPHMKPRFTAKTWILILALVIEQCEVDSRLQQTELYVDDLLQQL